MTHNLKMLVALAFISSCSKDKATLQINNSSGPTIPNAETHYPLKKGNWWVYDYFNINTQSGVTQFWYRDSVYITGDTIINGHKYYHQLGTGQFGNGWWLFLRDSAGYMLTLGGEKVLFSLTNYSDTLTIDSSMYMPYLVYQKMIHTDTVISVPAGNFHSISKGYIWTYMNNPTPKNEYLFFGRNIGMTQYCHWHYPQCINKIEGRLVKYYVQ